MVWSLASDAEATRRRALVDFAGGIRAGFEDGGAAAGLLAAGFVLTTLVLPLLQFLFVLALWLLPLAARAQARLLDVADVVSAWALLDVFAVTMLLVCAEYGRFAEFAFKRECLDVQKLLDATKSHEICFHLEATLEAGAFLLLAAGLVSGVLVPVFLRAARDRVDLRLRRHPKPAFVDGCRWWALSSCLRFCC